MNHAAQPRRFVITAGLLTESPLAIHSGFSGQDLAALDQLTLPSGVDLLAECDQLVMRDGHGWPYIPGSSLKGVLREFVRRDGSGLASANLLLRALAGLNLDPVYRPPQLGSGTHYGWGRMICRFASVRVQSWTPQGKVPVEVGELDVAAVLRAGVTNPPLARWTRVQFNLGLSFQGPFLVNDPSQVAEQHGVSTPSDTLKTKPDHVPRIAALSLVGTRIRALPLLPSTSFMGALRSRLEFIFRTIHRHCVQASPHGQLDPVTEDSANFAQRLFGLESQQSGIWCSEFIGDCELPILLREMVAIDRFTGSVAGSAKFNAAYFERKGVERRRSP